MIDRREEAQFTAGAHEYAAEAFAASPFAAQRNFAATLRQWAVNARRRGGIPERGEQLDLFGASVFDASTE